MATAVEYRPIYGRPYYRVGDDGSVWSKRRSGPGLRPREEWKQLKPVILKTGYPAVNLDGHTLTIHTLVLEAFVGKCPRGMECRHKNGIKTDVKLSNLCWGTRKENHADRIAHGTNRLGVSLPGSLHPSAKLSESIIPKIRAAIQAGGKQVATAREFGISRTQLRRIVSGEAWKHVS